jgi:alpha-galactosidase
MTDRLHLRGGGVSLLLDLRGDDARVLHWGAELGRGVDEVDLALLTPGAPHTAADGPVSLLPQASRGWRGTPGLTGDRGGRSYSPRFVVDSTEQTEHGAVLHLSDAAAGLSARIELTLDDTGLLVIDQRLGNAGSGAGSGADAYRLTALDVTLPVPGTATESLDLAGRWAREKHPQRRRIDFGTWSRAGRLGRTGHDSTLVVAAGTAGFSWRSGEVWAVHLGWSGDHESRVERTGDGQTVLAAGELLHPGEVVLRPGEEYRAPLVYAAYSGVGLDGVSARFHDWLRARATHPRTPRPVVLNTWEAVYFDHDLDTLKQLADAAADLGVERFVLDDGWFLGRRNDKAGLGDWYVDPTVWPNGLGPLIDHVRSRGMQFGLWVEPEMINEDSDLAREHPDWISGPGDRLSLRWRNQQVLDLVNPDAWHHIFDRLDALLTENRIAYLKWDQNRDQLEMGHDGRAATHAQTLAVYRLLDALRVAHPGVEIESCSSGGARVDLGILARTDRVWASDTNDALERQTIQRWTQLVLPPELIGQHVGPHTSHTTGRTHDLSFRIATALFGHFGIEWDVRTLNEAERAELKTAIAFYKEHRALLHTGCSVRLDRPDDTDAAYGVVAADRSRAIFAYARLITQPNEVAPRIRFEGLDPDRDYRVAAGLPVAVGALAIRTRPLWLRGTGDSAGAVVPGRVLQEVGLPMPGLHPEHACVITFEAV